MNELVDRMAESYVDEQIRNTQNRLTALREARRIIERGLPIVWHIAIHSPWKNLGKNHDDEKDLSQNYHMLSLRDAIRAAATDFCVLNGRVYPGYKTRDAFASGSEHKWRHWDVQGSWYVALVIAPGIHMQIPKEMYVKHVNELREDTDEIYGPEAEALKQRKLPTIP